MSHCGDGGCVGYEEREAYLNVGTSALSFKRRVIGTESYGSYELGHSYGPFQPVIAASASSLGDVWGGVGWTWEAWVGDFFVTSSFIPGLYVRGEGPRLGSPLEFRSILGVGYEFPWGKRVAVTFDHRSNGDTRAINPGVESWSVRYGAPSELGF